MRTKELVAELRSAGLIASAEVRLRPLPGGVSSDILLVEERRRRFVVKRALAQLRVRDDWFADVDRNRTEQAFFSYAVRVVPESVPRILYTAPEKGWFAMEFLEEPLRNWKRELMEGRSDPAAAELAGRTLGRLHFASWGDASVRRRFATLKNFTALRIDPYLLSTAQRVPRARGFLEAEAARLAGSGLALVHGDYSPKNLFVAPGRLMILDAEAAWFGDPAFDVAFLLTHLHLKAFLSGLPLAAAPASARTDVVASMLSLAAETWRAYAAALGPRADAEFEARTVRLLLCLLLARVHGKSPVDYLIPPAQPKFVTDFVLRQLANPPRTIGEHTGLWGEALARPLP